MAIELLTPFTKVELEPEIKDKKRKQVGILGGNFNPVHNAHLVVADQVRQQLGLDKVLLMPEYEPPHVDKKETIDEGHRLKMLELAIEGIEGLESEKCEMVTPILTYSDMETLQELVRQLRHAGAKSDATRGCGVHIHIGAKGHTPQTLRNLANIMASHESLIADALNLDHGRMRRYCRTVDPRFLEQVNRRKPTTMTQLADIWYSSHDANCGRSHHYNDSRYHMLNYHATFTKGTVEFRLFQFDEPTGERRGGLHAGQLKSYIQPCLALSQMAKMVKTASPKPQQNENPKYAMRTWLLRLGFIGDEFKTAREILTKRLAGDTAFRHGREAA